MHILVRVQPSKLQPEYTRVATSSTRHDTWAGEERRDKGRNLEERPESTHVRCVLGPPNAQQSVPPALAAATKRLSDAVRGAQAC